MSKHHIRQHPPGVFVIVRKEKKKKPSKESLSDTEAPASPGEKSFVDRMRHAVAGTFKKAKTATSPKHAKRTADKSSAATTSTSGGGSSSKAKSDSESESSEENGQGRR
jgi:hypothetical protein